MARRKQKGKVGVSEAAVKRGNDVSEAGTSPATETQEQKPNAFKLLMDSRHKSIGTNSPGKEKNDDPSEMQEIIEKKNLKVKRNLALQKMAEAKGSIKRKEMEDYEDKCIERQMEKRAERLKSMLKPMDGITSKKKEKVIKIEVDSNSKNNKNYADKIDSKKSKCSKTLQLVDMFNDVMKPTNIKPDEKIVPKEDEEFLSKLSPSLKKKENMLCYFKKIEKSNQSVATEDVSNSSPIKVKVPKKDKNKSKKKRLSLHEKSTPGSSKDLIENISQNNDIEIQDHIKLPDTHENNEIKDNSSHERKKRKRKDDFDKIELKVDKCETVISVITVEQSKDEIKRPKRIAKRPVKYVDDVQLSSSDEDLHIFTPRKKKRADDKTILTTITSKEIVISDDETKKKVSKKCNKYSEKEEVKKPAKLAPIFASKPQLNPEQLDAKQKFLYSGVPDQIKKIIAQQKNLQTEVTDDFLIVVHVQQKETDNPLTKFYPLLSDYSAKDDDLVDKRYDGLFSKFLASTESDNGNENIPSLKYNASVILQNIKELYPKFPVHRTYRQLKTKCKGELKEITSDLDNSSEIVNGIIDIVNENPEYLNWTDKYKATSSKHMIGNFESIQELKKWLLSWTEMEQRSQNTNANESDSSDFYDTDSNSRDSFKNNLLIVTGPVGCGKTSSVYAVAAELAIKVIEVNASSKRTGKLMLQDLQEATQSHKVNRGGSDFVQKSQDIVETVPTIASKRRGRPKKVDSSLKKLDSQTKVLSQSQPMGSTDQVRTGMSLILVDDADIVFDQDDGFSSAISQLIQCSKRPVILVASSLTCSHLQKFLQYGKVVNMHSLSPRMLGTWLDIMCLADGTCWPGLGAKVLDYFRGDIRKSINCLQFCMTSFVQNCPLGDEASSQNVDFKQSQDGENSNGSWLDSEGLEDKTMTDTTTDMKDLVWKYLMEKDTNLLHVTYPKHLFNFWWNVPSLLKKTSNYNCQLKASKLVHNEQPKHETVNELEAVANVMDSVSISDYFSHCKPDTSCNITSVPWYSPECDSVSEQDCLESYNRCHEVTGDIIKELLATSVIVAQKKLQCDRNTSLHFPSMAAQRQKDRVISRHDNLTSILNQSAALDRKALALDYWSTCRTICRIERNKTDTISKRNNRFCHYLKSINVMCRNDAFDSLGDSLFFKGKIE